LHSLEGRLSYHFWALSGWIGLILFSSTGLAARWAHALYDLLFVATELNAGVPVLLLQKSYHVFLFTVLGLLIASAAFFRLAPLPRAILWCFAIGLLSEALQLGFEGRGPSFTDVLLNGASGSTAAWIWLRFSEREKDASTVSRP
jgi:VanZ family protein